MSLSTFSSFPSLPSIVNNPALSKLFYKKLDDNFNVTTLSKAKIEELLTGNISSHTHSQYVTGTPWTSMGYLTAITKAQVEAVLTGAITTHTHNYQSPLTTSDLFLDTVNHRVGFGTASPAVKFHFKQSVANGGIRLYGHDAKATSYFDISINVGGNTVLTTNAGGLFYNSDVGLFDNKYQGFGANYQVYSIGFDATNGYFKIKSNFTNGAYPATQATADVIRIYNGTDDVVLPTGNLGIGIIAPTARLHLPAGTATASTSPLKFTAGTLLSALELGALEFTDNGTDGHLYITRNVAGVLTRTQIV